MTMYKMLYVDDRPATNALQALVKEAGFTVITCSSAAELTARLQEPDFPYEAAVVDYRLEADFAPRFRSGIDVTKALIERSPEIGVIGISAFLESQYSEDYARTIGDWLLAGARWFCSKRQITGGRGFEVTLGVLVQCAERSREWRALRNQADSVHLDQYQGLLETLSILDRIAHLAVPVLILGETGTGKELLAKRIHTLSGRSGRFVEGNCANLRGELAEVMLHGQQVHHNDPRAPGFPRRGWFEQADGGTVFLDEIGDLPPDAQASLLRVLQERQVRRVLGDDLVPVNFRLVAATNHDLESDIAAQRFRRDLYFRISAFPIRVPPLSERRGDIPKLLEHLRMRYSLAFSRDVAFDPTVIDFFVNRKYPGNIRELENLVQRVVALSSSNHPTVDEVAALDLPLIAATTNSYSGPEAVTSQRQYAELLTQWMDQHIDELCKSPDYRSRTAFVRAAVTHVCNSYVVPGDYPRSEQYILKEIVRSQQPLLFRRIVEAGAKARRQDPGEHQR